MYTPHPGETLREAETWLRGQVTYDLWQASRSEEALGVEPAHAAA